MWRAATAPLSCGWRSPGAKCSTIRRRAISYAGKGRAWWRTSRRRPPPARFSRARRSARQRTKSDALVIADCVTSLGGMPVLVDETGIDIAYSCTQKGLGCPPGLSPLTVSPRAWERLRKRTAPVDSFYLDLRLLESYFRDRKYHHTASATMFYALREALAIIAGRRHRESLGAPSAQSRSVRRGHRSHGSAHARGRRTPAVDPEHPARTRGRGRCQGAPAPAERIRHRDRRRLRTAGRQSVPHRSDGLLIHGRKRRHDTGCPSEDA